MPIDRNIPPTNDELANRRAEQFDNELQADPELAEGPASGGRIAMFAIALVAILGVVFYGLNTSSTSPDATPTAQTAPAGGTAQAPRAQAGQTTGSSMTPSQPAAPPAARPSDAPAPAAPQNNSAPAAPSSN